MSIYDRLNSVQSLMNEICEESGAGRDISGELVENNLFEGFVKRARGGASELGVARSGIKRTAGTAKRAYENIRKIGSGWEEKLNDTKGIGHQLALGLSNVASAAEYFAMYAANWSEILSKYDNMDDVPMMKLKALKSELELIEKGLDRLSGI